PNANVGERLLAALDHDEFCLFSQSIASLDPAGGGARLHEVTLRLNEEEDNHLPPGAFLRIAEDCGLVPSLDRWMVRKILKIAAEESREAGACYLLPVSPATIAEKSFGAFVRAELATRGVDGAILCLEFAERDVLAGPRVYRDLIEELEGLGCRFAIASFGGSPASVAFFRQLRVSYLRLDGNIVFNLERDPEAVVRVQAINHAAHQAGMQIVAECVETEGTIAMLRRTGTDFAQGLGIAAPCRMAA
ncbi:MAG TPA: EAL domain-containing protein, partial [Usitatibacter sp.]|nr:EAL domain-containing protein [Usitatibacter sp.]